MVIRAQTRLLTNLRRAPVYREILQYSYQDYLEKFLIPYYLSRGIELSEPESLEKAGSLRTYAAGLRAFEDEGTQTRPGGVDGGGEPGRTRPQDDDATHSSHPCPNVLRWHAIPRRRAPTLSV